MKLRILIGVLLLVLFSGFSGKVNAQGYYGYRRGYYRPHGPVYMYPPYGRGYGYYRPRPMYRPHVYYYPNYYYPRYRYYHRW